MAKDNLFLGFARGAVGDVVFTRSGGTQVSRARNRAPLNPQTVLQALQRVFFKHCSLAYRVLSPICDHSFESAKSKGENYDAFMRTNIEKCRVDVQYLIDRGDYDAILASRTPGYPSRSDDMTYVDTFWISQGSAPGLDLFVADYGLYIQDDWPEGTSYITYEQFCSHYRLQRGDQLTFVFVRYIADSAVNYMQMTGIDYARVILEPEDGDMSAYFATDAEWRYPSSASPKNKGQVFFKIIEDRLCVSPVLDGDSEWWEWRNAVGAAGVIVSRFSDGRWTRSRAYLRTFRNPDRGYLGQAVQSFMPSSTSSQYLNQADV